MPETTHIAMWSGPRNLSTAMMYSFGNRPDTFASDEPFYAHYLANTSTDHAMAEEVIRAGEPDWRVVAQHLRGPAPDRAPLWYQKHMCHHMLPHMAFDWTQGMKHCLLIRHPREVLLSLAQKTDAVDAHATGLPQQVHIAAAVQQQTGQAPLVVDARDILENPRGMLTVLCDRLGIAFDEAMLRWPKGPKPFDGVWAPHWYDGVWASEGFGTWRPRTGTLSPAAQQALDAVLPLYAQLAETRLRVV